MVAFAILLFQISELFRFSLFAGLPLSFVAFATVVILGLHIFINVKYLKKIHNPVLMGYLFLLCIGIPILFAPYHLVYGYLGKSDIVRILANNILYFEISLSTIILVSKYSIKLIRSWFVLVLTVILIGFGLEYVNPGLFYALKLAVWGLDKNIDGIEFAELERVGGFYLKSTYASISIIMLTPVGILLLSKESFTYAIVVAVSFLFLVFLTGSRSGLVVSAVCSITFILPFFQFIVKRFKTSLKNGLNLGLVFLPISLVLVGVLVSVALLAIPDTQRNVLLERTTSLFSSETLSNDVSLNQRSNAQFLYLEKIVQNAVFGYGAIYRDKLRSSGDFWLTSHNTYIEMAFFYGVFYVAVLLILIISMMSGKWNYWIEGVPGLNYMQMLAIGLLLYCLFANTMMQNRSFFFAIGFLLGVANKKK